MIHSYTLPGYKEAESRAKRIVSGQEHIQPQQDPPVMLRVEAYRELMDKAAMCVSLLSRNEQLIERIGSQEIQITCLQREALEWKRDAREWERRFMWALYSAAAMGILVAVLLLWKFAP